MEFSGFTHMGTRSNGFKLVGTKTGRFSAGEPRPDPVFKVGDRVRLISDYPHQRKGTVVNVDRQHESVAAVSVNYDTDPVGSGTLHHSVLSRALEALSIVDDLAGLVGE